MAHPNHNDLRIKSIPGKVLMAGRGGELKQALIHMKTYIFLSLQDCGE